MELLTLLLIILGGLVPAAASWSVGHLLLRRQQMSGVLKFAAGAALLSTLIFLLAQAGLAERYTFYGLALLALAPTYKELKIQWRTPLTALALLYLVYVLPPEIQADAMHYHLAIPQQMLETGFLSDHPGFYEVLPQGLEMLFAFAMAIGGPPAAKLLHFIFFLATLPLIYALAVRLELPEWCAPTASLLYFAAPVCAISGTSGYNDAAEVFFLLAAVLLAEEFPLIAGLAAGFCYAIKISGLIIIPPALLFYVWRRDWIKLCWFAAGASLMIAPWMIRAFVLTGNPMAPLFNRFFPNPYFYIFSEQNMSRWLRTYGTVKLWETPLEVTIRGARLEGLIGPAFLAIPIAFLAMKQRAGRILLTFAALLLPLWLMNVGARFLMPALPFIALAIVLVLPKRIAWTLAIAQAILCLPPVLNFWTDEHAWRLRGFPIAAALRLESDEDYLKTASPDYNIGRAVNKATPPDARILDMAGLPTLYTSREAVSASLSAEGYRLNEVIHAAMNTSKGVLYELTASWPQTQVRALRIVQHDAHPHPWSMNEIQLLNGETAIAPESSWELDASPNAWEAPRALDRNLLTPWSTREAAQDGMYFQINFGKLIPTTGLVVTSLASERSMNAEIQSQDGNGEWHKLTVFASATPREGVNLRPTAGKSIKKAGVQFIAVPFTDEIGRSFKENTSDWNMDLAAEVEGLYLFHLR